jgi:hypothetical protein
LTVITKPTLWTEFLPIPPYLAEGDGKWMKVTESLVGSEPLESREKQNMDPGTICTYFKRIPFIGKNFSQRKN